ncbi:hypothetical protein [Quadrisphaera sp. INWT6]|uniref:hypothetical protein n=1 Tax=Quadrisphaera sp. INWT6 TaxID=2596917 RepID=UPI0018920985|nr:hypothetical protein [Quadrisphaera sp. INWT6]MBF5080318.1 hypothetical protein [Quadrisphaera sp. INWT6]
MLIVALVGLWVVVALGLALVVGRSLAISGKSDRWRHGHREVRDLRKLKPVPDLAEVRTLRPRGRSAA